MLTGVAMISVMPEAETDLIIEGVENSTVSLEMTRRPRAVRRAAITSDFLDMVVTFQFDVVDVEVTTCLRTASLTQ